MPVLALVLIGCSVLSMNNPFSDVQVPVTTTTLRYTISFNGNGGSGTMDSISVCGDETADIPDCTIVPPVGMRFHSWNTAADGKGLRYYSQGVRNLTDQNGSTIVLFAQWIDKDSHRIIYDGIDDVNNLHNPDTFLESENVILTDVSKTGYGFIGWFDSHDRHITGWHAGDMTSDVRLTARWETFYYTISFDANYPIGTQGGGGEMSSLTVHYDETADIPDCTVIPPVGMTFDSWNTESDGTGIRYYEHDCVHNLSVVHGASIMLYAQWLDNGSHRIRYYRTKQADKPSRSSFRESDTIVPESITAVGYTFCGWSDTSDDEHIITGWQPGERTDDISLYAVWRANTYTVMFDANGGVGTMPATDMTYDVSAALPPNVFTRDGRTFIGWHTKPNAAAALFADSQEVINLTAIEGAALTLYAVWQPTQYTVVYNANGGSGSMPAQTMTADMSSDLLPNAFTRTGYHLTGWSLAADTPADYTDKQTVTNLPVDGVGTAALYAVWQPNSYTIIFNANGGSGTMAALSMTYDTAKALTANAFTRTGYTFSGWAAGSSGAKVYDNKQSVNNLTAEQDGKVTLYAVWTANTYSVVFNKNGGTGTMANQTITYDTLTALTANAYTRTGWTLVGWETGTAASTLTYTDSQKVKNLKTSGSVTLYAIWQANTYTVKYNPNGGVGVMPDQIMTYGTAEPLQNVSCIRKGWTFLGWSTSSTATSAAYTNAQSKAFNLTSTNGGDATLYAVWTTPAVGDIVYEDGLIARTAVANKKPIGVIYATAANSYSVVYIGQSASASWQSGTGTNYCNGLTVNHQIWTVPTKAQLDTIYTNKTKLNNALQLIIDNYTADELGVTPSSIGQSWSQTEAGSSVNYFLDTGGVYSQYTGGPTYPTRALTTYTKYAVGDIVYSDGTFASGIISGKTPIGVVYGISGGTYKVVYAGVLGPDQWKPGRLTTSCSSLTVGSKSWTIPTKDELAAMFNSLSAVNKSLQKIIDNYTAASLGYTPALIANSWSSTANDSNTQWYLSESSGLTTMYNNGPSCPARAVTTY